jgi:hypothetical protein
VSTPPRVFFREGREDEDLGEAGFPPKSGGQDADKGDLFTLAGHPLHIPPLKAAVGPLLAQAAQEADQGIPEEDNQNAQDGTD